MTKIVNRNKPLIEIAATARKQSSGESSTRNSNAPPDSLFLRFRPRPTRKFQVPVSSLWPPEISRYVFKRFATDYFGCGGWAGGCCKGAAVLEAGWPGEPEPGEGSPQVS